MSKTYLLFPKILKGKEAEEWQLWESYLDKKIVSGDLLDIRRRGQIYREWKIMSKAII